MKLTEEAYNIIQNYLRDELTDSDLEKFEEFSKEKNFLVELKKQADILSSLNEIRDSKIRATIKGYEQDVVALNNSEKPLKKLKPFSLLAASFVLLAFLFLSIYYFTNNNSNSQNQLYAELYTRYPVNGIERGDNGLESREDFKNALSAYSNKEFEKASNLFSLTEESSLTLLYQGICFMETKEFEKAESNFTKIINNNSNTEIKKEAEWYAILTQLASGKLTESSLLLKRILQQPNHPYRIKAQKISSNI